MIVIEFKETELSNYTVILTAETKVETMNVKNLGDRDVVVTTGEISIYNAQNKLMIFGHDEIKKHYKDSHDEKKAFRILFKRMIPKSYYKGFRTKLWKKINEEVNKL